MKLLLMLKVCNTHHMLISTLYRSGITRLTQYTKYWYILHVNRVISPLIGSYVKSDHMYCSYFALVRQSCERLIDNHTQILYYAYLYNYKMWFLNSVVLPFEHVCRQSPRSNLENFTVC